MNLQPGMQKKNSDDSDIAMSCNSCDEDYMVGDEEA